MLIVMAASSKLLLYHLCATSSFLVLGHLVAGAAASPFSFSFDFSNRSTSTYRLADLGFEGDAVPQAGLVDLTCSSTAQPSRNCTGRMSYKYPVPFYDTTTGEVASFTTQFTFAMNGTNKGCGNGIAFFLSSYPSRLPLNSSGGHLGLRGGDRGADQLVTVEFNTYYKYFCPCDTNDHLAIDLHTAKDSFNATCLPSTSLEGTMTASITFDSTTNMLLASLHFHDNSSRGSYQVSMHLPDPITSLLPPEVALGFSAATGSSFQLHQILSWSFDSTLAPRTGTGAPEHQPKPAPVVTRKEASARETQPNPAHVVTIKKASARATQPKPAHVVTRKEAQPMRALMVSEKDQISAHAQLNQAGTPESLPSQTSTPDFVPYPNSVVNGATGAPESQPSQTSTPYFVPYPVVIGTTTENLKPVIEGTIAFVAVLGFILVWVIMSWNRWKRTRDSFARGIIGLKRFEHNVLAVATGRFSEDNKLGEGAFGAVYKGSYTDDNVRQEVAVKQIKQTAGEVAVFMAELKTISGTRHMNLVELKGWCCSRNKWDLIGFMCWCRQQKVKLFLVYELVPNGTLHDHLHGGEKILPWEKRYQIVKGIGYALRYLHHECKNTILHRDIKPRNILLDYDFNPKIADFGLSRTTSQNDTMVLTSAIGTDGYMDPLCKKHGNVEFHRTSDVYSFGIVLLEIACTDKSSDQVKDMYRRNAAGPEDAADGRLRGVFDRTQMERVIFLGLKCSHLDEKQRPLMQDAMKFLEDGRQFSAITDLEGQQGARILGTISSDEHAFLPTGLHS